MSARARALAATALIVALTAGGPAARAQGAGKAQPAEKAQARKGESPAGAGAKKEPARKEPAKADAQKGDAQKSDLPGPPAPPPLYEAPMLRLAETLGALAFLRDLCGPGDGAQWRERMQALVDAEDADEARRGRLAGAFNRGFQDYAMVYRFCTPAARTLLTRRLSEGERLSRDLAARWGR